MNITTVHTTLRPRGGFRKTRTHEFFTSSERSEDVEMDALKFLRAEYPKHLIIKMTVIPSNIDLGEN